LIIIYIEAQNYYIIEFLIKVNNNLKETKIKKCRAKAMARKKPLRSLSYPKIR